LREAGHPDLHKALKAAVAQNAQGERNLVRMRGEAP
jgi:hypothetical protein